MHKIFMDEFRTKWDITWEFLYYDIEMHKNSSHTGSFEYRNFFDVRPLLMQDLGVQKCFLYNPNSNLGIDKYACLIWYTKIMHIEQNQWLFFNWQEIIYEKQANWELDSCTVSLSLCNSHFMVFGSHSLTEKWCHFAWMCVPWVVSWALQSPQNVNACLLRIYGKFSYCQMEEATS